ncbi:hypothetical protein B0O99DRAFT_639108 [Bisporella sp. PMI_857]|nr:hypothetical protein B0O99DRAFT_639108 [Bisporella sp. PMI_857]
MRHSNLVFFTVAAFSMGGLNELLVLEHIVVMFMMGQSLFCGACQCVMNNETFKRHVPRKQFDFHVSRQCIKVHETFGRASIWKKTLYYHYHYQLKY